MTSRCAMNMRPGAGSELPAVWMLRCDVQRLTWREPVPRSGLTYRAAPSDCMRACMVVAGRRSLAPACGRASAPWTTHVSGMGAPCRTHSTACTALLPATTSAEWPFRTWAPWARNSAAVNCAMSQCPGMSAAAAREDLSPRWRSGRGAWGRTYTTEGAPDPGGGTSVSRSTDVTVFIGGSKLTVIPAARRRWTSGATSSTLDVAMRIMRLPHMRPARDVPLVFSALPCWRSPHVTN